MELLANYYLYTTEEEGAVLQLFGTTIPPISRHPAFVPSLKR